MYGLISLILASLLHIPLMTFLSPPLTAYWGYLGTRYGSTQHSVLSVVLGSCARGRQGISRANQRLMRGQEHWADIISPPALPKHFMAKAGKIKIKENDSVVQLVLVVTAV